LSRNPDLTDVNTVYHDLMKKYTKGATEAKAKTSQENSAKSSNAVPSNTNGMSSSSKALRKLGKARHNASKYKSESEDEDQTWQEQCLDLLDKIWHCKDAVPFRQPVDIVDHPDYYHVIDTPMDLQTCKEELRGGNYQSPLEFHKDMSMIFSNSKQYNTDKKSSVRTADLVFVAIFSKPGQERIFNCMHLYFSDLQYDTTREFLIRLPDKTDFK